MSTEPPHTSIQVEEKGGPYYATPDRFNKAQDFKVRTRSHNSNRPCIFIMLRHVSD